ncbi:MAG: lysophospholipid acyltransferase family protein [Bacillota bacterium]
MLYGFAWWVCRIYLLLVRRMKITGVENVPLQGGLVLISNHVSYWDPVIIGCALPRKRHIYFMAKQELFKIPLLGRLINKLGAFPVKRDGADRSAIRTALEHLAEGRVVGIFPEGTRSKTGDIQEPHMGAAMLSIKGSVPVLPVAVIGSRGFLGKVNIVFGRPLRQTTHGNVDSKSRRSELNELSRKIMHHVAELMEAKSGDIS